MANLALYELMLIAGKRGIKNYKNMLGEELLSILDKSERNFKNLSQMVLEQIAKMENLSQSELEQITKMTRIKDYKNMSKDGLLIALLKSQRSLAELYKS